MMIIITIITIKEETADFKIAHKKLKIFNAGNIIDGLWLITN